MQTFQELNLSPSLLRAVEELGYTSPTPIQSATLPLLLGKDTDFLGLAATGTGKTAAFGLPLLERIDQKRAGVQALILCPTRELAMQVAGQIDLLGKFLGVRSLAIYGGTGYSEQLHGLRNGATIVVGTPGRVVDHIEKGTLKLNQLKTLVLDEADEMISMGFKEDLEAVLKAAPKDQANIWLFSATMGTEVRSVADAYLKNPQKVQMNRTEMLPDTVEQLYYKVHEYDKPALVCKLIDMAEDFYGIIFCQTKALVADLNQFLIDRGYRADCLHGDLDQTSRDRVMKAFRDRKISILVATDVACRGLDVKDVTHVVNYSIPRELDNYVHRIGRTGRSGKTGIALSLVTFSHRELIGRIERMTKSKMKEGTIPSPKEIALKRLAKVRAAFETQGPQARLVNLFPEEWKTALAQMTQEEIAGRFLNLLVPDLLASGEDRLQDSRPQTLQERKPQERKREDRDRPRGDRRDARGPRENREYRGNSRGESRPSPREESREPTHGPGEGHRESREQAEPRRFKAFADKKFSDKKFSDRKFSDKPKFSKFSDKPKFSDRKFTSRKPKPSDAPPWENANKSRWKNKPFRQPEQKVQETHRSQALALGGEGKLKKKKVLGPSLYRKPS